MLMLRESTVPMGDRLAEENELLHQRNAELERLLVERTRSLDEVKRELEALSAAISHDLRSPLQVIEGFSSLALQESAACASGKLCEYLQRIQGGARRMHHVIGHLLQFSQIANCEMQAVPVDLSNESHRILFDLRASEPGRQVDVFVKPDMADHADPSLIRNVLQHLLANAWKFTSREAKARIEFSRDQRDGKFVYQVRDNGVGFDMPSAHRLFHPFVRLHDKRDFPGSGVGLATAKRIVERHGGTMWAESSVGEGAAFYFTLAS